MTENSRLNKRPAGLMRFFLRAPIWLYRLRLGWLLGRRFVLLTHTGRNSDFPRQTVLEVVRYDDETGVCVVASGWGEKSDWVLNITANPQIQIQVGNKSCAAIARRLTPVESAEELLDYSRRNPRALQALAAYMGFQLDGTQESVAAMGRGIPMFKFQP